MRRAFQASPTILVVTPEITYLPEGMGNMANTLHAKAGGDLDVFFLQANELPGVKAEIVEKDSLYHLYFMECTCGLFRRGYVSTPLLCECSRQSILYVLHSLWKDRRFRVTICGSILRGSPCCKMKIEAGMSGQKAV